MYIAAKSSTHLNILSLTHTHTRAGTLPSPPDTITKVKDSTNTAKHRRKNRSTFIQALHTYMYYYLPHRVYIQCNICTIQCDIVLVYMYHYVVLLISLSVSGIGNHLSKSLFKT